MKIFNTFLLIVVLLAFNSCSKEESLQEESLEGQGQSLLAFTVQGNLGCGVITITVDKLETKTMDGNAPPNGFVSCQDRSPSVVQWDDIPAGTYSYTASCSGYTWTGTRVLGNGSCSYLRLTAGSAD